MKYLYEIMVVILYVVWVVATGLIIRTIGDIGNLMFLFFPVLCWVGYNAGKKDVIRERKMEDRSSPKEVQGK